MTPLVIHPQTHLEIHRIKEQGKKRSLALVYHFKMTAHDSAFCIVSHRGLIPKSRLYGNQGHHFLIPYHAPQAESAVQQVILTQYVCNIL